MALNFSSPNWLKAGKWLLPSSAFIYLFSLFFPWVSDPPNDPDGSWGLALHAAFEHHLQFGRDLVFTFGPWGFLYGGYNPPTFPIAVMVCTLLAFAFWWAGWRVACHFSTNKLFAWFWFIGFAGIAGMRVEQNFDVRMVGWTLLLLFLYFFVEDRPISARQVLLVVLSGMLALTKFTGMIGVTAVVVVIAADNVFRRRRFPWIVPLFAASILFFWIVAGQSPSLLWPYLRYSWVLADGYTEAMMWTTAGEIEDMGWLLVATATLIAATGYAAWVRRRFFGIFPVIGLGAILFLNFKHVCVRHDQTHEIIGALQLLLVTLACLAVTWPVWQKNRWWVWPANFLVLGGIGLFCSSTFNRGYREAHVPEERLWVDFAWTLNIKNILAPAKLLRDPAHLRKIYGNNLAEVRMKFPLPPIEGGVDVYPWNQAVLIAHDLRYDPRPVIQSYSAYAPELAELNAAHLRSAHAPDNILFDIHPLNNNFPSLEDGLSWPELLTRYDVKDTAGIFMLLKRSATPREFHLQPFADLPVHFGEPIRLPATNNGPLWAELEINKSVLGSAVSTLYKPPMLTLAVSLRDGRQLDFRLVPGMARSGFLLSPLIENNRSFVSLAAVDGGRDLTGLEVTVMTISAVTASGSTRCYQSPMRLRLYQLDYPRQDLKEMTVESATQSLPPPPTVRQDKFNRRRKELL
jgi:hypothetical protein